MEHLNLWKQRRGHVSDDVWTHAGITSLVLDLQRDALQAEGVASHRRGVRAAR